MDHSLHQSFKQAFRIRHLCLMKDPSQSGHITICGNAKVMDMSKDRPLGFYLTRDPID